MELPKQANELSNNVVVLDGAALVRKPESKEHLALAKEQLLDLTVREFLERLGAGRHEPGAGTAAAINGLVACMLVRTGISLCRARAHKIDRLRLILPSLNRFEGQIISTIEPFLMTAVQVDAEQFDRVFQLRKKRDTAQDPLQRQLYAEQEREELLAATNTPLEIARHCITLAEQALELFDRGFQPARGDSGVAISAAASAAQGALSIAYLNLIKFSVEPWLSKARHMRETADVISSRADYIQNALRSRVTKLRREGTQSPQINLL